MFKRKMSLLSFAVAALMLAFTLDAHAAAASATAVLNHLDFVSAIGAHGGAGLAALGIGSVAAAAAGIENHATTSKWFRIAVEGATTDGRTIERDWITQMAATYNRELYGARVNCEHIRGIVPMAGNNTSPFGSYGDVLGLRAEQISDGPLKGKYGLFAQIQPTPELIALSKKSQKIYTSAEVAPSFADTKQAYLIGLAITDSPASLGTEILQFAAGMGDQNPFAARKQHRDNLFTEATEVSIEFEPAAAPAGTAPSVFSKVAELLGFVKKKERDDDARFADLTQAVEALANYGREQSTQVAALRADLDSEKKAREAAEQAFSELKAKLSSENDGTPRPKATGQNSTITTDC